jgi:hypothetical protein
MSPLSRRACLLLVAALLSSLLVACGEDTRPGGLEGQVLGMLSPTEQPVLLNGAVIAINGPGGSQTTTSDAQGKYRFDDLRPGAYGFAASYQGPQAGDKSLQPEERLFSISPAQQETISVVLLAEGIAPPPTPPPAPVAGQAGSHATTGGVGGGGGLLSDPFFWYFLFNRPGSYGYNRPPVLVGGGGSGPVVIDSNQPQRSSSGRVYTDYGEPGATGLRTKPLPEVTSKGTTRPGASGSAGANSSSGTTVRPPNSSAPAARPPSAGNGSSPAARPPSSSNNEGSKGTTRPGGSAPSVKPPTSKPPAVRPPSGGKRGR